MKFILPNKKKKPANILNNILINTGAFINRHFNLFVVLAVIFIGTGIAFAAPVNPAETLWTDLTTLIGTWVTRLGGVVIFVGAVMFALGWKSDDAEQKSRGISTIIAGAIVTAVAFMVDVFFNP